MTHDEARELFTARIDDALDADARARLDVHLGGCADCRRELDRLERTVALLRRARPVHAPAGFADRVIAAAPPVRRRRLARVFLHPLRVKLPLQAAALLVVAVTVGVLYRDQPELQDAVHQPAPSREEALARRQEAPAPHPNAPVSADERAPHDGARADAPEPEDAVRHAAREQRAPAGRAEAPAAPTSRVAPPAPAKEDAGARGVVVRARWAVADREQAVRDVEALVARLGGTVLSRGEEAEDIVLEVALPAGAWDTVARELGRHGGLRVDSGPASSGPLRAQVRIGG